MVNWNWYLIIATSVSIIAATATVASVKYAYKQHKFMEKTFKNQLLLELFKDYRSEKMLNALTTIHKFIRECKEQKKDYVKVYMDGYENDKADIHCQRRVLEKFYHHLAWLHNKEIIDDDMVFDNWNIRDLGIIEKIIPIEEQLFEKIYGVASTDNDVRIMKKLCVDADNYDKKIRKNIDKK